MKKSKIEWCDSTWNPVTGCFHGCEYCYARRIAERFKPFDMPHLTEKGIYERLNELDTPIITECKDGKERTCAYPYGFEPTLHRYRLGDYAGKKGRTIFVCSMADLFGSWVPDSWIEEVFAACEKAPQHRYLFLTKNPQRYIELAMTGKLPAKDNMWYGTTATGPSQEVFWSDIHHTFVSIEPILEPFKETDGDLIHKVDWVILGAETGNRKDKVVPERDWIEPAVKILKDVGKSVFMKDSLIPVWGDELNRQFPWQD